MSQTSHQTRIDAWLDDAEAFLDGLLITLTFVFFFQLLRVFLPSALFVYGRLVEHDAIDITLFIFGTFALGGLGPLFHWLCGRRALFLSGLGIGLCRLLLQFLDFPLARLWLSTAGILCFLFFLPLAVAHYRSRAPISQWVLFYLLALGIDVCLFGLSGTLDLSWNLNFLNALTLIALSFTYIGLLLRWKKATLWPLREPPLSIALALISLGLCVFLDLLLWQNLSRTANLMDRSIPNAFFIVMEANFLAMLIITHLQRAPATLQKITLAASSVALVAALSFEHRDPFAFIVLGHLSASLLLYFSLTGLEAKKTPEEHKGTLRLSFGTTMAFLLMIMALVFYYLSYVESLFLPNRIYFPMAALLLILVAWLSLDDSLIQKKSGPNWLPTLALGGLLLIPTVQSLFQKTRPESTTGKGFPIRVMSYNIHMGYDETGTLKIKEITDTIRSMEPDVIALQEVHRGTVFTSGIDTLEWISTQLDIPYRFHGVTDPLVGNAILSRYPILDSGTQRLPNYQTPTPRGYLWAVIDVGNNERVRVVSTHLQDGNSKEAHEDRIAQTLALKKNACGDSPYRCIVMGDFNATPATREIAQLEDRFLVDVFNPEKDGSGNTFPASAPTKRIDYILASPQLLARDFQISETRGSDHQGIAVTLSSE